MGISVNYATIKKTDVANGPGIRVSLFVSGCRHACKGCFNAEAWDFSYGQPFTEETEKEILEAMAPDYIRGFSVLGGEPLDPDNCETVLTIIKKVKEAYPEKDIWCYTGYVYDRELLKREEEESGKTLSEIFSCLDVLVDGRFVEERKNLRLAFRGSENQRLIDMKKTRAAGHVVCLPEQEKGMKEQKADTGR